jgi:hypothetical protein
MRYINAGLKKLKNNTIGSNLAECTAMNPSLRIVVVAPDLDIADPMTTMPSRRPNARAVCASGCWKVAST